MSRINIRSTCNALMAAALILAVLARVPLPDGLLLHDHGDQDDHGIHAHAVTLDELCERGVDASWHRRHGGIHDDDRDDRNNDSDDGENADSLFIFVSVPPTALRIHGSTGAVIASIQHSSSNAWPRSMLPGDSTATADLPPTPWPSAHPLRAAFSLDALLQSSHALLL